MAEPEIEFFIERALLASKDRDSADWQRLMKDIMATGQGVGVLARLAGRLPALTLSTLLWNNLPVLSEFSREDYLAGRQSSWSCTTIRMGDRLSGTVPSEGVV